MANYLLYVTLQGDTFDIIALDFYNDEYKAPLIAAANAGHAEVIVFDAGVRLKIPIIAAEAQSSLPPWKRGE